MGIFKRTEEDLTTGNLTKKLIIFTLPIILTTIFQLLYTQVDLITLRLFGGGNNSVASIGINGSLINLIIGLFIGLSVGANVSMAQAKGRNDKEYATKILHSSILLAVILGLFVGALGASLSRVLLEMMHATEEIIDNATDYLIIYFSGMVFSMVYNYGAAILRALGDSKKPLYVLFISGIINVLLDLLFVIVFKLDVIGVGLTTVISEAVAAILVIYFLYKDKNGFVKLSFKKLKLDKEATLEIIRIGLPSGLQSLIFSISNVAIQGETNLFGVNSELGNTAASNIENYVYAIVNGISQSTVAFVAQNYGAKKYENIRKTILISVILELTIGFFLGALVYALSDSFIPIFINNNQEATDIAKSRLFVILLPYFTCGIMDCFASYYRGSKFTIFPMIATLFGTCILRLLFIFTLFKYVDYFHNITWLYASYPISWCVTCLIYIVAYPYLSKKIKNKLEAKD